MEEQQEKQMTVEQMKRAGRLYGSMPYGGSLSPLNWENGEVDTFLDWAESLRDRLEGVARGNENDRQRLAQAEADLATIRKAARIVLGNEGA